MKIHQTIATALVGAASLLGLGAAHAQVTVTANPWYNNVTVGAPLTQGVYGQIVLGNATVPPPVYSSAPVIIQRTATVYDPLYLYVPPGHRKNWSKHCRKYGACGQPVLFVQDRWYSDVYAPRYREVHYRERYDDRGGRRDHHDDRGHGRGHGNGHGNGHGKGHGRGHD